MWRKSSHSLSGHCVETDSWRKSSHSNTGSPVTCVEAGHGSSTIGVRDSTLHGGGPVLKFSPESWREFTGKLK